MRVEALDAYLQQHLPGYRGPGRLTAFAEGQSNPTYLLDTPGRRYVLRRKPDGDHHPSAHAVDREFRVQRALWNSGVPVARVRHLCTDPAVIGTAFYVMDHLDGRVFWDPALPELDPEGRARVYDEMARVLAAIHSVDLGRAGLADYGRAEGYYARQLARWTGQYRAAGEPLDGMEALIGWLTEALPGQDGDHGLVHGDFRIDNLLFDPVSLTVRAVFDWELSTLGDPFADLAYQVMQRAMGRDWHLPGLAGLDPLPEGIPEEEAYVAAYCARRGIAVPTHWGFAKGFAFFRFAAICHGVGARARAGTAASPDAARVGAMAAPLARMGADLVGV